jgi:hypothetical protein
MKKIISATLMITVVVIASSCKKQYSSAGTVYPVNTVAERKIRFQLYTNNDFSTDTSVINFSIFIRNANRTLFDSALTSMQIKDIPDALHRLVIEKTVTDNSDLAAGFNYDIHNVGISWYIDTSRAGNPFKTIDFPFQ